MAGHPNNKVFASGSHDHTIKIWDIEKTKETMQLADHKYLSFYSEREYGHYSIQETETSCFQEVQILWSKFGIQKKVL
jgi:WD40 repeat protein